MDQGIYALDLNGANIGRPIAYRLPLRNSLGHGEERYTGDITMITHKKNGHVLVRYGKNNRQVTLPPLTIITAVV